MSFSSEDFEEAIEALKEMLAKLTEMREQGFTQVEVQAQIAYEMLEDDLAKKRKSKKKARAINLIDQTLRDLKEKGVDTTRLEEGWNFLPDHLRSSPAKSKKKKAKGKTREPSSYNVCIQKWFEFNKKDPEFWKSQKEELAQKQKVEVELITDFKASVAFCKEHHKELEAFVKKEAVSKIELEKQGFFVD